MSRKEHKKGKKEQSIRPKGAGVYTYVAGQEVVDGDDDAATSDAAAERDAAAPTSESDGKRKNTLPGPGTRARSGRAAAKLTQPGTGASVWKASEPPKPKDTWPGTGGPTTRPPEVDEEPDDGPPSEPLSTADKRERIETMPGPGKKGAAKPKAKLAGLKHTLIGTGAAAPASEPQPVSMPPRGGGAPHDRALPFDAAPNSRPVDRSSSVPPSEQDQPTHAAAEPIDERDKATQPAMRAARSPKVAGPPAAKAARKTEEKPAAKDEREADRKAASESEGDSEVEADTKVEADSEVEPDSEVEGDDEGEGESKKKAAGEVEPDDEGAGDSEKKAAGKVEPADEVDSEREPKRVASASTPPASQRTQRIAGVPVKWALGAIIAVSLAFVVGIFMSSGPISIRIGSDAERDEGRAPQSPGAAAPTTAPTAEQPAPESSAAGHDEPTPADDDDGSGLPASQGYLLVKSATDDLYVYARGARLGPTGEKLQLACGRVHVRLGDRAPENWYSPVEPVRVACRSVTKVTIKPTAPVRIAAKTSAEPEPATTASALPSGTVPPPPTAPPKPPPQPGPRSTAFVPADL